MIRPKNIITELIWLNESMSNFTLEKYMSRKYQILKYGIYQLINQIKLVRTATQKYLSMTTLSKSLFYLNIRAIIVEYGLDFCIISIL